jgi:hypothetical protein
MVVMWAALTIPGGMETMLAKRSVLQAVALMAVAVLASGCLQSFDQLQVNKDGSGVWRYKIILGPQLTGMLSQQQAGIGKIEGGGMDGLPPIERKDLENALGNVEGAKVTKFEKALKNGSTHVTGDVEFSSIEALIDSDFGSKIGWTFTRDGDDLVVTGDPLTGSDEDGEEKDPNSPEAAQEFAMAKSMMAGMRINRRIVLPSPSKGGNAHAVKGNMGVWDFQLKADTTLAQMNKASTEKLEYRTSAEGLSFKLPLVPKKVEEGGGTGGDPLDDF